MTPPAASMSARASCRFPISLKGCSGRWRTLRSSMDENAHRGKRPDGQITAAPCLRPICLSSPIRKNILIVRKFGLSYIPLCPAPPKGAYHDRRETRGGMWWTLESPKTKAFFSGRQNRVVLSPRRWCQVCVKSRRRRWPKSPEHRGERGISRKPLRGECRVIPV